MNRIDLHVHSSFSDGTLSPEALVMLAKETELTAFALTDHDTTEGLDAAILASRGTPVTVIPGIEFSTRALHRDIHILGYLMDYQDPGFQSVLQSFLQARAQRNETMCRKLRNYTGFPIELDALKERWPGAVITRAHMASWLVEEGYVKTRDIAFSRYLGDHAPCFVPKAEITPGDAIRLILQYNGVPVLAHPLLYTFPRSRLLTFCEELCQEGLMGIEAIYTLNRGSDEAFLRSIAEKCGLLITGGSDFHGANKPDIALGTGRKNNLRVPGELLDALHRARSEVSGRSF